jgi:hypothetical protein
MFYVRGIQYLNGVVIANFLQTFDTYQEAQAKATSMGTDFPQMQMVIEYDHRDMVGIVDEYFPVARLGLH